MASASPTCRRRSRKKRALQRIIATTPSTKTPTPLHTPMVVESFEKIGHETIENKEDEKKDRVVPCPPSTPTSNPPTSAQYCLNRDQNCTEVQMSVFACPYVVYIYYMSCWQNIILLRGAITPPFFKKKKKNELIIKIKLKIYLSKKYVEVLKPLFSTF